MNWRGIRHGGIVAALAAAALVAGSQPALALGVTSAQTWGGPGLDFPLEQAEGVAVAPDGSTYLTGQTSSFGTGADDGTSDIFLLKYAPDGTLAWQRTYGVGSANEFGVDVDVAPDGSVWVAGELGFSALLVQFDANGNLQSERTFAGVDSPRAIDIADDGSIYVTGFAFPGAGQGDAFVMKCAPDGTLGWVKTWGSADGFDIGTDVAATSDGNVYLTGDSNNGAFLVRFNADGNVIWERTYQAGTVQDFTSGQGVGIGSDGGVYLAGTATLSGSGQSALLVKFSPGGDLLWERTWQGRDSSSSASGIAVAAGGSVYITGAGVSGVDNGDILVVEFLPDGQVRRAGTWGGADAQRGQAIALAPDGGPRIAGGTSGPPPFKFRTATKKEATPVSVVGVPTGATTTPAVTAADPDGIVLTPNGSETYAGDSDAVLLTMVP